MATFADAIAALEGFADRAAAGGAAAAADAMAATFVTHERDVTLSRTTHARGTKTPSARGQPPSRVTGWLGDSFRIDRASGGSLSATSRAGPTAIYSRVQELGARIVPVRAKFLHWHDFMGENFRKSVFVGPHPYMRPGVEGVIRDGSLRENAEQAFAAVVMA